VCGGIQSAASAPPSAGLEKFPRVPIFAGQLLFWGTFMPTYVYRCDACGHKFDAVQRMTQDPLTDCPACEAPALVKQIQPAGFALKGTGWYVTDFRDKGKKPPASDGDAVKSSETSSTTAETKTEAKTEAKAETKTETKSEPAKATGTTA